MVCVKRNSFAEENECDLKKKPETFKDCDMEELKDCGPKWHISEWTEVRNHLRLCIKYNYFSLTVFKTLWQWVSKANHQMPGS